MTDGAKDALRSLRKRRWRCRQSGPFLPFSASADPSRALSSARESSDDRHRSKLRRFDRSRRAAPPIARIHLLDPFDARAALAEPASRTNMADSTRDSAGASSFGALAPCQASVDRMQRSISLARSSRGRRGEGARTINTRRRSRGSSGNSMRSSTVSRRRTLSTASCRRRSRSLARTSCSPRPTPMRSRRRCAGADRRACRLRRS